MFHAVAPALELAVIFIRLIVLENVEISSTSSSDALAAMSAGQAVYRRATQPLRQSRTDRRMKDGRQTDVRATSIEARYGVRTAEAGWSVGRWGG